MDQAPATPEERYAALVEALLARPEVSFGDPGKRGFGRGALQVKGKIFAMLSGERLVLKLPRRRVDALVESGAGTRFDPRRDGRLMKEWLVLDPNWPEEWLPLAEEALAFVSSAAS